MWMFGKVNQDEYDQIEEQGWEIVRKPTREEVDKFCDPSYKGKSEVDEDVDEDGEFFVIIWSDCDLITKLPFPMP